MLLHFAGSLAALKLPFSQMEMIHKRRTDTFILISLEGIALYFMFPLCHFALTQPGFQTGPPLQEVLKNLAYRLAGLPLFRTRKPCLDAVLQCDRV